MAKFYGCWISDTKSMQKISTKSINSNEWVINKKFWNPSLLRKLRKGERLQRVEFQSICAVMTKFYGCWNSDTKSMPKIPTEPINSNERMIDQKTTKFLELISIDIKFSNSSQFRTLRKEERLQLAQWTSFLLWNCPIIQTHIHGCCNEEKLCAREQTVILVEEESFLPDIQFFMAKNLKKDITIPLACTNTQQNWWCNIEVNLMCD